jgi:HEPN domain-containing protein
MPHDPALVAETHDWLKKASEDLKAAELLLAGVRLLPPQAAFHAQQAAEKAQKAFLTWQKQPFPKTHDLRLLGTKYVTIDATLDGIAR